MALIAAAVHYEIPPVWITEELLGQAITLTREGTDVRLDLPGASDDDYQFRFGGVAVEGELHPHLKPEDALVEQGEGDYLVRVIRVVVNRDEDIGLEAFRAMGDLAANRRCGELLDEYTRICDEAAAECVEWIRFRGRHYWLPPTGEYPRRLGSWRLVDVRAEAQFGPECWAIPGGIRVVPEDAPLTLADWEAITDLVKQGPPSFPDLILTDARYALDQWERWSANRAVVLAATACEAKVRNVARTVATDTQAPLVDFLLTQIREMPQSPPLLMHKLMSALTGRSLHAERAETHKRIQKLFTVRNRIVHRGVDVAREEASILVDAAVSAFAWLDDLAGDHQQDTA